MGSHPERTARRPCARSRRRPPPCGPGRRRPTQADRRAPAQEGRTCHILLGEQALCINLGGTEVMRDQLRRSLDATDLPGLSLGIIPARARLLVHPGGGRPH
ncbi:Scr1 family TA system antitoxin-like transcriptional regulator [Streptomyces sp. 147326]|uniref:Scr1 family TA system antitoxin-like transcriptional regulator n=1 Tax=Streptomyces sp. 147326 TaxID=3074379 RepID=UPI0038575247